MLNPYKRQNAVESGKWKVKRRSCKKWRARKIVHSVFIVGIEWWRIWVVVQISISLNPRLPHLFCQFDNLAAILLFIFPFFFSSLYLSFLRAPHFRIYVLNVFLCAGVAPTMEAGELCRLSWLFRGEVAPRKRGHIIHRQEDKLEPEHLRYALAPTHEMSTNAWINSNPVDWFTNDSSRKTASQSHGNASRRSSTSRSTSTGRVSPQK